MALDGDKVIGVKCEYRTVYRGMSYQLVEVPYDSESGLHLARERGGREMIITFR